MISPTGVRHERCRCPAEVIDGGAADGDDAYAFQAALDGGSGDLSSPSPPAEKATARQDQARKASTCEPEYTIYVGLE